VQITDVLSLKWEEFDQNPLIYPTFPSWYIADPTFLPPELTPDRQWHLFAHSILGIHHFISSDGIAWKRLPKRVSNISVRPFLYKEAQNYYIFYERILKLRFTAYTSRIEARRSTDLMNWSEPVVVLEPSMAWHREASWSGAVGNPCVVAEEDMYRLYYSAGLVYLKDCAFYEPKYVGCANSNSQTGPYTPSPDPVLSPKPDDPYANLGTGAIKVLRCSDGYVGFQNGIYWDRVRNHSGSAIRLLASPDGTNWEITGPPILKPDKGWKKSFVYMLDVRLTESGWRLYFNARSGWLFGLEYIGLAYGKPPRLE
jgi:hypothetical protein